MGPRPDPDPRPPPGSYATAAPSRDRGPEIQGTLGLSPGCYASLPKTHATLDSALAAADAGRIAVMYLGGVARAYTETGEYAATRWTR